MPEELRKILVATKEVSSMDNGWWWRAGRMTLFASSPVGKIGLISGERRRFRPRTKTGQHVKSFDLTTKNKIKTDLPEIPANSDSNLVRHDAGEEEKNDAVACALAENDRERPRATEEDDEEHESAYGL
ncbi:hypothetical protein R6Q57_000903 [Mikania cordata]